MGWHPASSVLLTSPELGPEDHAGLSFLIVAKLSVDAVVVWTILTVVTANSLFNPLSPHFSSRTYISKGRKESVDLTTMLFAGR